MTAALPSKLRGHVYLRDQFRCVVCGTFDNLTIQHREAIGMGGTKRVMDASQLLTACLPHNMRFESDMQDQALALGWKLRRFRGNLPASSVPYFAQWEREWFLANADGTRTMIVAATAQELIALAGGNRKAS